MTIVTSGDDRIIEQIVKQLNKLIDVIKVVDLNESEFVEREMALIKVHTRQEDRAEALRIADVFRAKVVDSTPTTYTIEVTGDVNKVEAAINLLQPLGIKELVRTGRVAIAREPVRSTAAQPKRVLKEEK
jgi:acetolactate synthase-1/3 small subunit